MLKLKKLLKKMQLREAYGSRIVTAGRYKKEYKGSK